MKYMSAINKHGGRLERILENRRVSILLGGVPITVNIILFAWVSTNLNNPFAVKFILTALSIQLLLISVFLVLETNNYRNIPHSVLIFIGVALNIIGTLALVTATTGPVVLNTLMAYIIMFGVFGFFLSVMGIGFMDGLRTKEHKNTPMPSL